MASIRLGSLTDVPEEDFHIPYEDEDDNDDMTGAFGKPMSVQGLRHVPSTSSIATNITSASFATIASNPSMKSSVSTVYNVPSTSSAYHATGVGNGVGVSGTNGATSLNGKMHIARRSSSLRSLGASTLGSVSEVATTTSTSGVETPTLAPTATQGQSQLSQRTPLKRTISGTSAANGSANASTNASAPAPTAPNSNGTANPASSSNPSSSSTTRPSSSTRHTHHRSSRELPRKRSVPRLTHDKDAEPVPSTGMYWSRAPVWGLIPSRMMRAHSVTLVDTAFWLFGGCDEREALAGGQAFKEVWCLDVETCQWSRPECLGEPPPPSRAHSATLVDRKIVYIGGGHSSVYYDTVYILDTITRRWSKPSIPGPKPPPRRAHSAVLYNGKIWIFGGGNGMTALADVWTLDVTCLMPYSGKGAGGKGGGGLRWEEVETRGVRKPAPRGYHTANLVGNIMIIIGGSDGKESFDELWTLDLDTKMWTHIKTNLPYKRLAHSSTQVGSYLFLFGGHNSSEYTSKIMLLNLVSLQYETRTIYGKVPAPRGYHAMLLADSRLFLIGGFNGLQSFDDVHILELAASAYLPQVTSFSIEALGL